MRVVLADDQALFRAGFQRLLIELFGKETEFLVAGDFPQAVDVVSTANGLDLVFCDLEMGGMERLAGLTDVISHSGGAPVIVLSASERAEDVRNCIAAGARAYVSKHEDFPVLHHVVELAMAGRVYAPVEALGAGPSSPGLGPRTGDGSSDSQPVINGLSARQRMVVSLLGRGLSNKEIARALSVAEGTVKSQLRAIYRRLGVRNRTEAALLLNRPREAKKSDAAGDRLTVVGA